MVYPLALASNANLVYRATRSKLFYPRLLPYALWC